MTCRFYREQEVTALLDMATTIEVVEESFRQLGTGGAENVPRHRATAPGFVLHGMHAAAEYLGFAGFKMYSTTRIGAKFVVGLYDIDSGQMVALIEADKLGQLRTAASSAVGARSLANKPITQLGIFDERRAQDCRKLRGLSQRCSQQKAAQARHHLRSRSVG